MYLSMQAGQRMVVCVCGQLEHTQTSPDDTVD